MTEQEPELPSWIGQGCTDVQIDVDDRLLRAKTKGPVEFGEVEEGWTIHLTVQSDVVVDAEAVGKEVTVDVLMERAGTVQISELFPSIRIACRRPTGQTVTLNASHPDAAVTFGPGDFNLAEGVTVQAVLDHSPKQSTKLAGPGAVTGLSGTGTVRIECTMPAGTQVNDLRGSVTFAGHKVEGIEFNAAEAKATLEVAGSSLTGTVKDFTARSGLTSSTITAAQLQAGGTVHGCKITVDNRFECVGAVTDTDIVVLPVDDGAPSATDIAVRIADDRANPASDLRVDVTDDDPPSWPWRTAGRKARMEGGSIECPGNRQVVLREASETLLRVGGTVWVEGDLAVAAAGTDGEPAVTAGGLFVGGALRGTARPQLSVKGPVAIRGEMTEVDLHADGAVFMHGAASKCAIEAGELRLSSGGDGVSLAVVGRAIVDAAPTGKLAFRGETDLNADATGDVEFTAGSASAKLSINSSVGSLTAIGRPASQAATEPHDPRAAGEHHPDDGRDQPPEHPVTVSLAPAGSLGQLTCHGLVHFHRDKPPTKPPTSTLPSLPSVSLSQGAALHITSPAGGQFPSVGCPGGGLLVLSGGTRGKPAASGRAAVSDAPIVVPVETQTGLHVVSMNYVRLESADSDVPPDLQLSGRGEVVISGTLGSVTCGHGNQPQKEGLNPQGPAQEPARTDWPVDPGLPEGWLDPPTISTDADGAVFDIGGCFHLGHHDGRITGRRGDSLTARWFRHMASKLTGGKRGGSARSRGDRPARVLSLDLGDGGAGQLRGVDPASLPLRELDQLRKLATFEPSGPALIGDALAGPQTGDRDPDEFDRQVHAERARTLAAVVKGRSVSGSSRTAAMWAAARVHHRHVRDTSWAEWAGRWPHRLVGYSQRPFPALMTWVVLAIGWWSALLLWDDPARCAHPPDRSSYESLPARAQWWRVVLAPASFFRLPGQLQEPPVFCSAGAQVMLFLSVTLVTLYLVIALRHLLATPTEESA